MKNLLLIAQLSNLCILYEKKLTSSSHRIYLPFSKKKIIQNDLMHLDIHMKDLPPGFIVRF